MPGSSNLYEGYPMPFPSPLLEAPGMPAVILPALQFRGCHGSSFRLLPAHTSPSQSPSECREAEKMLTGGFPAPPVKSEEPFPLGPFPRHIWIHDNTPQDSLDKACHKIWKRVQGLSEELQPVLWSEPSETLRRDNSNSQHK